MKKLHDFLNRIRPLTKASVLEKMAGLPINSIGKHYRWIDGKQDGFPINPNHAPQIFRALCAIFGSVEVEGWRILSGDEPAIITIKSIPGRAAEMVEQEDEIGNVFFEYFQPEYRNLYDDFDFVHYFLKDK